VHPQLWQAYASTMCILPPVGTAFYCFLQGHAEQAGTAVDLCTVRVPPSCRVVSV